MKTNKSLTQEILQKVKQNKKYKTISNEIILNEIENYLKSNPQQKTLNKINKQTIKHIRAKLHKLYTSYQTKNKKNQDAYLQELKTSVNKKSKTQLLKTTNKLLSLTLSTKERLVDYQNIYKQIFKITKKPKTILDLGCGFNPFSYPYMALEKVTYYAYDIDNQDIKFLNNYFKIMNSQGLNTKTKAFILDIRNPKRVSSLPNSDIVFMFKLIDLLTTKQSEQIILFLLKKQKTKFIIPSFALKTITRKSMNKPKRKWFELMLSRNNLKFQTFQTDNELFYVVKNNKASTLR